MGFYSDLFLRPKQAMQYAYEHPSLMRGVMFVVLASVIGIIASFIFIGSIFWVTVLESLVVDVLRWIIAGIVIVLLGMVFKQIPLNGESISRALSMLSHINVYGSFMFIVGAILLPVVTIPETLAAMSQLNSGIIGQEEFNQAMSASIASGNLVNPLSIFFFLLAVLFWLYAVYAMYLAVSKYLNTTVFKSIVAMLIVLVVQSIILLVFFA